MKSKKTAIDFFTFLDYFFLSKHDKEWRELGDDVKMEHHRSLMRVLSKGNPVKIHDIYKFMTPTLMEGIREEYKVRGHRKPQFVYRKFSRQQVDKNVSKVKGAIEIYGRKYNIPKTMVKEYITSFPEIIMPELLAMQKELKSMK